MSWKQHRGNNTKTASLRLLSESHGATIHRIQVFGVILLGSDRGSGAYLKVRGPLVEIASKSLRRFTLLSVAGILAMAGAWLSGVLALLDLVLLWEGSAGDILTGGFTFISILIAVLGLLAGLCGSAGAMLAFMRRRFNFVMVSLDIEFVSGLLSLLISQGFFLQLGLPIILLSQMGMMFTLLRRHEFTAGEVTVIKGSHPQ